MSKINPPLKDRAGQAEDLAKALRIISEAYPFDLDTRQGAHTVYLQSSDQSFYGFVLNQVKDGDNYEIDVESVQDEVNDLLCDLDWNSVVEEDKHGQAVISLVGAEPDSRLGQTPRPRPTLTRTVYVVWSEREVDYPDGLGRRSHWSKVYDDKEAAEDLALRLAVGTSRTTQIVEQKVTFVL